MITSEYLKSILFYIPESGKWIWLIGKNKNMFAGGLNNDGYLCIYINRKCYYAHRLAFLYMTGEWPKNQVDHKNLNTSDCKWNNLREANKSNNGANRDKNKNNTSGVKGVWWNKRRSKWVAEIKINNKKISLGYFDFLKEAALIRANASLKYQGEFARVEKNV